jgi:alpha-tubulin suppressor-like RCC1 family protein
MQGVSVKNIDRTLVAVLAVGTLGALGCGQDAESPTGPEATPALSAVTTPLSFMQVSVGSGHACGVTTDNRAYCWGSNSGVVLGIGGPVNNPDGDFSTQPMAVVGGLRFRFVSASVGFTCGLTTDDLAYCWGFNGVAQLGNGTRTAKSRPVAVAGGRHYRQLKAGSGHACAVTFADVAYCWGDNTYGQLGDGTTNGPLRPVKVAGGLALRRVLAGRGHTCAAKPGGKTYCWGLNDFGQLGDGTLAQRLTPVAVKGGHLFGQLSAGNFHSCGVEDHKAFCWGRNRYGALGDGTITRRLTPAAVAGGLQFEGVSAGLEATCGVTTSSLAYCWGHNHSGRLGDGTVNIDRLTPTAVVGGLHFKSVSTSLNWFFTCGVTTSDRAYCWGDNSVGQLGTGDRISFSEAPVAVVGP